MRYSSALCAALFCACVTPTAVVNDYKIQWQYGHDLRKHIIAAQEAQRQVAEEQEQLKRLETWLSQSEDAYNEAPSGNDKDKKEEKKEKEEKKARRDLARKAVFDSQEKLRKLGVDLVKANQQVQNDVELPPADYPTEVEQVHSSLSPPPDPSHAFALLIARCQAAEREKSRQIRNYIGLKWPMLILGASSSTIATILAGVNDDSNIVLNPSSHTSLRIANIISGSVGVLFTAIYGFANFDTRIDTTRQDLLTLRKAMDDARSQWPGATPDQRAKLLQTMAVTCNAQGVLERPATTPTATPEPAKGSATIVGNVGELLKEATKNALAIVERAGGKPLSTEDVAAISARFTDIANAVKPLVEDEHTGTPAAKFQSAVNTAISAFQQDKDVKTLIDNISAEIPKLNAVLK